MNRTVSTLTAAILALGLAFPLLSPAYGQDAPAKPAAGAKAKKGQKGQKGKRAGGMKKLDAALAQLNLTADQKPKVDKAKAELRAEVKKANESTDPEEKKSKNVAARKAFRQKLGGILNADQKKKLAELMPKRKKGAKGAKAAKAGAKAAKAPKS
jgi:hypothetical protein